MFVYILRGTLHHFRNVGGVASRMLVLLSPAGFENLLFEVGGPAQPGQRAPPLSPEELGRTLAVAPKYGLELRPQADG